MSSCKRRTKVIRSAGMPEVYVPVLKGRQGEFAALGGIQPSTRQCILPLVEIVPGPAEEPGALRSVIDRTAKKLSQRNGRRLLLDAGLLPTDVEVNGGLGPVAYSTIAANEEFVIATPVIRLNDELRARRDAAKLHMEHGNGIALRLGAEDLDEDSEDIDDALSALLQEVGIKRADADLVLDLGAVVGDLAVRAGSRIAADAVRGLSKIEDWRQVVVAAGAFPTDLSTYGPWTIGEPIRYDAA